MPTPPADAALARIFSIASPRTIEGKCAGKASAGPPPSAAIFFTKPAVVAIRNVSKRADP